MIFYTVASYNKQKWTDVTIPLHRQNNVWSQSEIMWLSSLKTTVNCYNNVLADTETAM